MTKSIHAEIRKASRSAEGIESAKVGRDGKTVLVLKEFTDPRNGKTRRKWKVVKRYTGPDAERHAERLARSLRKDHGRRK